LSYLEEVEEEEDGIEGAWEIGLGFSITSKFSPKLEILEAKKDELSLWVSSIFLVFFSVRASRWWLMKMNLGIRN
jgi:hypothetical protein